MESSALTDLVVITGFSGAGKSTAMAVFEDAEYFCVDNLPPEMIRSLVDLFMHSGAKVARAAVVSDARGREHFEGLTAMLDELGTIGVHYRILFLEADEETLLRATRRRVGGTRWRRAGSVATGIARERELLAPLRAARRRRDRHDPPDAPAMLRRRLTEDLLPTRTPGRLAVTFQSFGFKYGASRDADLMFDVRFLPNPHYEPELRPFTGKDPRVVEFINRDGALDEFYEHLDPLLDYLLPQYLAEGKSHLVIAIGCTGGRHRSVAIAEHLAERYRGDGGYLVDVAHRDEGEAGDRPHRVRGRRSQPHGGVLRPGLLRARGSADGRLRARGRLRDQRAGGVVHDARARPRSGYGHLALRASGKIAVDAGYAAGLANGGAETTPPSPPGLRPRYGSRYYAAYLADPDGLRVELVAR